MVIFVATSHQHKYFVFVVSLQLLHFTFMLSCLASVSNKKVHEAITEGDWKRASRILKKYPHIGATVNVETAARYLTPIDIFELLLDQQPNAPVEKSGIIFILISHNRLKHFRAALVRCPGATEVKEEEYSQLPPLLFLFWKWENFNVDWIGPILRSKPQCSSTKRFCWQDGSAFSIPTWTFF